MTSDPVHPSPPPGPTPYPNVNEALRDLLSSVQSILGNHFRGMYLSGSIALGDFDPARSDIDFAVATDAELPRDLFSALQAMHARFNASDSPWATEVEAAYIPLDALRRHDPDRALHPHIQRGPSQILEMDQLDSGWVIQRWILREHGVVVAGPAPHALIDPVQPHEMRQAVIDLVDDWWGPMRNDPAPLQHHGYQVYAVLTMCRMLYTLDSGAVVSKPEAACWALGTLGGRWAALIQRALAWRNDHQDPCADEIRATLDLIHYTVEQCQQRRDTTP